MRATSWTGWVTFPAGYEPAIQKYSTANGWERLSSNGPGLLELRHPDRFRIEVSGARVRVEVDVELTPLKP